VNTLGYICYDLPNDLFLDGCRAHFGLIDEILEITAFRIFHKEVYTVFLTVIEAGMKLDDIGVAY
jgi:hypothetical protein